MPAVLVLLSLTGQSFAAAAGTRQAANIVTRPHEVPSTVGALVVNGPAGSVRVQQSPYRLQVLDSTGRPRLSEVANPQSAPVPYAGTDPAPLGSDTASTPPLVAPLVLTVGAADHPTYPATPFSGDLLAGAISGVQYSATSVLSSVGDGAGGLRITVGSNAPTGQEFVVDIRPDGPRFAIDVAVTGGVAVPAASELLGDSFEAPAGAAYHGFGGRHESTDLRGTQFDSWLEEENFGAGPATGPAGSASGAGDSYLFPDGPAAAYYVQPQFITQDFGLLDNQDELLRWRMAPSDTPTAWQLTAASTQLRLVVAPEDPMASIPALTEVTGRQQPPPSWALEPQIDRLIYVGDSAAGYQAKVASDLQHLAAGDVPDAGYRIEGWATLSAADLAADIARLHALGIHPLLYFRSFSSIDGAGSEQPSVFTQAVTSGYFGTTATGTPYLVGGSFGAPAGVIDFTNPAARAWFAGRIDAGLDLGADGFMADFGEQVPPDMHFADGETGATMHNRYPVLYQQLVQQTVQAYEHTHPGRQIFYYNRAGYAGSAGYESANFPGDETTDFSVASGLASQTPDMLNRGTGGAFGFTTDIGGYEDVLTGATSAELLLRWAEWAVLSPVFRLHGSAGQGTHVPWNYDATTLAAYRRLAQLRERVAPLVATLWQQSAATGLPLTTPLWLAYPDDPVAARQDQEWLLGRDVLAAPVVIQGATTRTAYLPAGCWTYVPSGTSYTGGQSVTVPAPVDTLSWFTRCGTTPLGSVIRASLSTPGSAAAHPGRQTTSRPAPAARLHAATAAPSGPARPGNPAEAALAATGLPGWDAPSSAALLILLALVAAHRRQRATRRSRPRGGQRARTPTINATG